MRVNVFSRGSNPAIDRPILRKSLKYAEDQVADGLADWADARDHAKGIVCLEMLDFGPRHIEVPKWAGPRSYQHHIEPRFERLTIADSPWLRYLEGLSS